MKLKYLLAASVVSLSAAAAALPTAAAAQQITSGVEGTVESADGVPLAGATVTVTDTRTGQTRSETTSSEGRFFFDNLTPGGPYTVTATAAGYEGQSVEEQFITLQGNTDYTFSLQGSVDDSNIIVVTGSQVQATQLAVGPGTAFGSESLEAFPSITRDVRDIIAIDPRVSIDRDNEVDRISCLGGNDRSNTFTVDGIVQADVFGLNGTPFAARNSLPLPFDTIRETSVEFAPFDVEYTDFTGCLVNVVTKSGANQFHGSAFFNFRNEDLRGDSIDNVDFIPAEFEEKRWGATLSGPIIPDRLFFFAGYEETDLGGSNDFGPRGAGFPNEATFVNIDQFNEFARIARDVYGQDVGGYPRALPEASERYFGRLDALITDDHRLELSYQRLEETNVESDTGFNELTGLNSFEDEGTISDYYSARLYSDWTDNISTELRVSRAEVGDVQGPVGFGEAQSDNPTVRLVVLSPDGVGGNTDNGFLSTGPGIFRSANQLDSKVDQAKFQVNVRAGDHQLKLGADINDLEVYNLFAINATGTLFFNSFADFEAGLVAPGSFSSVFSNPNALANGDLGGGVINATPTGDINEAAARFNRTIFSVYAQDEWQATDRLNITAGVRAQFFSGDAPRENPEFIRRYGFSNAVAFDDLDPLILPRFAATYELNDGGFFYDTRITGGVGLFSGGDPVVYFSNAFSNNGFSTGEGTTFSGDCAGLLDANGQFDVVTNGQFTGFPQCAIDAGSDRAAAGLADTQSTDPNFKIPQALRANLGLATRFGTGDGFFDDWTLNVDYIYSRFLNTLNFVDLAQTPNITRGLDGYTVDGRPIYSAIDPTDPDAAGCNATLVGTGGTPPVWENVTPVCFNRIGRDDEIQLTNGPDYESHVVSFILAKRFNGGFLTEGGSTRVSLGYAYTDADNFRNTGSSTATSSYDVTAAFDRQAPAVSTSNYETRHKFSAAFSVREELFEGYRTGFGINFRAQSGNPYSITFAGGGVFNDSSSGNNNALLYIPADVNDPNVVYRDTVVRGNVVQTAAETRDLLDAYIDENDCIAEYRGQSIPRNTCRDDWFFDLDLRLSQQLPGPGNLIGIDDRFELFADFDNFLNLLNDSWNVRRTRSDFVSLVEGGVDGDGRYVISDFDPFDQEFISTSSSIWRIQLGVRYEF